VFSAGVPRIVGPVLKAMSSLRILIVDDHEAVRNGVRTLLASSTHWSVCGEASDGVEAVEKAKRLYPDVVLMDVSMPRMDGIEATRMIRREVPESDVIIVSQNDPVLMQKVAVEAGAKAFVEKSRIAQDLLRVIEALGKNGGGVIGNRQSDRTADSSAPVNLVKVRGTELLASDTRERYRQKIARITLDSMVQFVGLLDAEGTVLEINHVALDAVGVKLSDVEARPFWTTFWWQVSNEVNATLREMIRRASQGEFVRWDTEIYGRAGGKETIIIDASLMPVKDEQGRVVFITAEGRDITEKKAHEREIARQREELAELDELKTQFFANISHEFRTPLTLMMGPLEDALAQSEGLSASHRERLELAHRNSLRLFKLVNTLLDFSRIEAGRIQASYEPIDLALLTAELASMFRSAIERAGMRLIIDCPALPEKVYVDRDMWEKIILNLLSNAFKFTFEGQIEVSLRRMDSLAEVTVRDTGTGIPADEIPRLFERFHRVRGARGRSYEGSGIGLALVQELVKLHGGSVRIESQVDRGSSFFVTIPFGKDHLPADRIGGARTLASTEVRGEAYVQEALRWLPGCQTVSDDVQVAPLASLEQPRPQSIVNSAQRSRILLADDNVDMREYVRRLLLEQYEVVAVANGESALESARQIRPNLILADIMMPRLDGFGLLRALRADPGLNSVPVILLSARAGEESRVEGLDAGADDYLVKPFSARELLARVRSHLAMEKTRREAAATERELRAAAELERNQIREMFMQAPAAIGRVSGPEHRWTFVNAGYLRVTGRDRADQFIGKTIRESLPELEGQEFFELLDTVYRTGVPYVGVAAKAVLNRTATGQPEEAYFNFVYQPLRDLEGKSQGILIHAVEVTHQEIARQEIEKRERATSLLAAIVSSSDDAIISKTLDGTITSWNTSAERLFGYTAQEAIGQHITLIIPEDRRDEEVKILQQVSRGECFDHFETMRQRKDGTLVALSLTISPVKDAAGRIIGASKVARDITERKRIEQALSERATLLDLSNDAIFVRDASDRITYWNKSASELYGYSRDEAMGRVTHELLRTEFPEPLERIVERLHRDTRWAGELVHRRKNGAQIVVASRWALDKDEEGNRKCILETNNDITEQKQNDKALRESEERLRTLSDSLEIQVRVRTEELERRNAEVLQQSEQLRELSNRLLKTQDDERRHIARELHDSAGQLIAALGMSLAGINRHGKENPMLAEALEDTQNLVQQLNKEIRTTSYLLHPPLLDENGLSQAIQWYMQGLMERGGLAIELHIAEDFGRLPADLELAVFRIVQESLTNIHRHSGSKTATICLSRSIHNVLLEIKDHGKGITTEKLAAIKAQRTGVGITGMRERVRHLKGEMDIQSNGAGATILVTLPLPPAPASGSEVIQSSEAIQ
jgi:PAS domain S-box-containing protein